MYIWSNLANPMWQAKRGSGSKKFFTLCKTRRLCYMSWHSSGIDDSSLLVSYTASVGQHSKTYLNLNLSNRSSITMFSRLYYSNYVYCRIMFPSMPNASKCFFFIQISLPKSMCYSFLLSVCQPDSYHWVPQFFPGIKRLGCEINHLLPTSAEVKNE